MYVGISLIDAFVKRDLKSLRSNATTGTHFSARSFSARLERNNVTPTTTAAHSLKNVFVFTIYTKHLYSTSIPPLYHGCISCGCASEREHVYLLSALNYVRVGRKQRSRLPPGYNAEWLKSRDIRYLCDTLLINLKERDYKRIIRYYVENIVRMEVKEKSLQQILLQF